MRTNRLVLRRLATLWTTAALLAPGAVAGGEYVAATWSDQSVHMLDGGLNDLGSFSAGSGNPNGIATDGNLIWTGHFTTQEVIAYDLTGAQQFSWPATNGIQGLEYIDANELAVSQTGGIDFYHPLTGALVRSIPVMASSVEGIAWDGTWLWQLDSFDIYATDISTGTPMSSIPNAATGCSFGGTGISNHGPDQLLLACSAGDWFIVSKTDGSVISQGNNGLDMFGVKSLDGAGGPGTGYCFGDGSGSPCPCGNDNDGSNGDAGCAHNGNPGGCLLTATGPGSATDTGGATVLHASGAEPGQPGLFFQGTNQINGGMGLALNDGLRCCGGSVTRMYQFTADGSGAASSDGSVGTCNLAPPSTGPNCGVSLSLVGGVSAGTTLCYQYWFRTPGGSPCGSNANLSNGYEITWAP